MAARSPEELFVNLQALNAVVLFAVFSECEHVRPGVCIDSEYNTPVNIQMTSHALGPKSSTGTSLQTTNHTLKIDSILYLWHGCQLIDIDLSHNTSTAN